MKIWQFGFCSALMTLLPLIAEAKPKMVVQLVAGSTDRDGLFNNIYLTLPDGTHAIGQCSTWDLHCGIDSFAPEKRITKSCFSERQRVEATCYVGEAYYAARKVNDITIFAANGPRMYHISGSWDSFQEGYLPAIGSLQSNVGKTAPHREFAVLKEHALSGDPGDEFKVGYAFFSGQGVEQDYAQAAIWFHKSAEQGNAQAQDYLGIIYENGYGTTKDDAQAALWYRKSAEQDNADAELVLGAIYGTGEGLPQNYGQSLT